MRALAPLPPEDDLEVVSSRVFRAPRARLFDAFRDPRQLARWWGPRGFTSDFHEFDLRPDGRWRFDLVGPDGARHAQDKTFVEIDPPARVALRHAQAGHDFVMTMTWDETPDGGTRLAWRMRFATREELEPIEAYVRAGNEENFDRLAEHLSGSGPIV